MVHYIPDRCFVVRRPPCRPGVIVTGGATGIGREICVAFAEEVREPGTTPPSVTVFFSSSRDFLSRLLALVTAPFAAQSYNVLCVDVVDKTLGPLSDPRNLFLPGNIEYFQADVSDPDAIAAAVSQARATFPSLNVLVNNVAVQHATSDCGSKQGAANVYSHELSMESWNYQHAVNVGHGANLHHNNLSNIPRTPRAHPPRDVLMINRPRGRTAHRRPSAFTSPFHQILLRRAHPPPGNRSSLAPAISRQSSLRQLPSPPSADL